MGIGPVPAVRKLFEKTGLGWDDIDLIELNEAFAAQFLACHKELGFDLDRTNVNGGAIALGHPIGATGARIVTTLLYEKERTDAKRGLANLCVSAASGWRWCSSAAEGRSSPGLRAADQYAYTIDRIV